MWEKYTIFTNNSDPITSTSDMLLRQNSVTAYAQQPLARRLASDHCATEIHRSKSADLTVHTKFHEHCLGHSKANEEGIYRSTDRVISEAYFRKVG
jgi:hypothetical protein